LCQTISGEGGIVEAIDLVGYHDRLLTRDIRQLTLLSVRLMSLSFVQTIILHSAFDSSATPIIPKALVRAAFKTGVARR